MHPLQRTLTGTVGQQYGTPHVILSWIENSGDLNQNLSTPFHSSGENLASPTPPTNASGLGALFQRQDKEMTHMPSFHSQLGTGLLVQKTQRWLFEVVNHHSQHAHLSTRIQPHFWNILVLQPEYYIPSKSLECEVGGEISSSNSNMQSAASFAPHSRNFPGWTKWLKKNPDKSWDVLMPPSFHMVPVITLGSTAPTEQSTGRGSSSPAPVGRMNCQKSEWKMTPINFLGNRLLTEIQTQKKQNLDMALVS